MLQHLSRKVSGTGGVPDGGRFRIGIGLQAEPEPLTAVIQYLRSTVAAWTEASGASYSSDMRELRDVKKLDDRFGQFLVRVKCPACGASRDIAAEALARLVGWSVTLESLAPRLRCSKCGAKGAAAVTPVGLPRPRGFTSNPH